MSRSSVILWLISALTTSQPAWASTSQGLGEVLPNVDAPVSEGFSYLDQLLAAVEPNHGY